MRRIKQALVYLLNSALLHVLKCCVFVQHTDRLASHITALHLSSNNELKYLTLSTHPPVVCLLLKGHT